MSTDRQRLKSAIRRIALTPEERRALLGEGQNKGGKPSSSGVGTSEAESDRQCCDGSVSSNANPGVSERDPDAGSQDGLDPNDPADLTTGEGALSGVTDCATGQPVCFDGSGFIPPEGWDDPSSPPIDPEFEEGYYYVAKDTSNNGGTEYYFQTCTSAREKLLSLLSACGSPDLEPAECPAPEGWVVTVGPCANASLLRRSCSNSYDPICDDDPPMADAWPSDGCTNLAIVNGSIVGSKFDPENDGSYSAPRSEMQLCDAEGNQISIRPAGTGVLPTGEQTSVPERITGGWKTFNSTTSNGYLYDSSGRQIAHIDGNEYSDPSV